MTKPLQGVRVLELARILAGPWAGQLLADLGAEVIKVERPGTGDDTRQWGPPFVAAAGGGTLGAAYFHATNRGKRSVTVDIATPEGQATVRRLAARCDVVVENFRVGALARYGLDAASLRAMSPRLVYCSITGFGQTGPYAQRLGYDFLVQAMGGIMDLTGAPEGEPQKVGVAFADIFTGLYAAIAILAALRRRDATGEGAHIDLALLDVQVSVLANQAMNYLVSGESPRRMGNAHPNIVPYQAFPAADGHLIIAAGNDSQFRRLCLVLGAPELAADPAFATNPQRVAARADLLPRLVALTATRARAELLAALEAAQVPAAPINSVAEVFADPQVAARGLRLAIHEPAAAGGSVPGVACPVVIDGERALAERASPALGADTDSVLAALDERGS